MAEAKVTVVVNIQFGDFDKLLSQYLAELPAEEAENSSKVLENFIFWLMKRDAKG